MYQILQSSTSRQLSFEIKRFLEENKTWKLYYGPYSDGTFHYQAVIENKEEKQLLTD